MVFFVFSFGFPQDTAYCIGLDAVLPAQFAGQALIPTTATLAGAKINVSLQLPVPTADASVFVVGHKAGKAAPSPSIPMVCIGPWSWTFLFRGAFSALQPGELF